MARDGEIGDLVDKFLKRVAKRLEDLSAEEMVKESAINPFMAKALGLDDFDSLARFYVYQRVGRSTVTSFGYTMEEMIMSVAGGRKKKGDWWDIEAVVGEATYYFSAKSGPRDMNKDQTREFVRRTRDKKEHDPEARTVIAMGYGKEAWPVITDTLEKEGLDPKEHSVVGRELYELLTGDPDYYKRLLDIMGKKSHALTRAITEMIDAKAKEVAECFRRRYGSVDEMLLDLF